MTSFNKPYLIRMVVQNWLANMVLWAIMAAGLWYASVGLYSLDIWPLGALFRVLAWGVVAIAGWKTLMLPFNIIGIMVAETDEQVVDEVVKGL